MDNNYKKFLIEDTISVFDALKVLNETGKRIVFLVNNGMLRGALTYGDVSRWILKGKDLSSVVSEAASLNPLCIRNDEKELAGKIFSERNINALPVVNDDQMIIDIVFKDSDIKNLGQIDIPVVIMAGGKGTRLYPYTKILPKPLIPIGDIPISEHIINRFVDNGCKNFYLIVNYKKNMIKAYYNEIEHLYEVDFVDEEKPLGTGGGIGLMKGMLSSTFILTNCDSIINEDYSRILNCHRENKNCITMICSNRRFEIPYGVIDSNEDGSLISMKEKPSVSYLTNTGTYIVEPEVINMVESDKAIGFPDIIQMVKDAGKKVGIYTVGENAWLDMGQFDSMEDMKRRLNIKD